MEAIQPARVEELAGALAAAARGRRRISLEGGGSKTRMGGPPGDCDVRITTAGLDRVLQYEPRDLTISVEAGMRFGDLARMLDRDGLMLPLDPPFFETATAGGVVAANVSGPRRRQFGTARDLVIGARFATLEGQVVHSGGMVVKNAAGLDMAKLLVGSFGTLAAIVAVNFRLAPKPPASRTYAISYPRVAEACGAAAAILGGVLQPPAVDLLNPPAAARIRREGFLLLVQAGGNRAVIDRYARELPGAAALDGEDEEALWRAIREFTPSYLAEHARGVVVRASTKLTAVAEVLGSFDGPALVRAGSGVCYGHFDRAEPAGEWMREARARGWRSLVEFRPAEGALGFEQWPDPGSDFTIMERIKRMFDPEGLLNRGRLHGRL
jgi:glycolate oxidase FAD binding subunit